MMNLNKKLPSIPPSPPSPTQQSASAYTAIPTQPNRQERQQPYTPHHHLDGQGWNSSSAERITYNKDDTFMPFLQPLRIPNGRHGDEEEEEEESYRDAVPTYSESASPNTTTLLSTPFSNEDIAYIKRNDNHLSGVGGSSSRLRFRSLSMSMTGNENGIGMMGNEEMYGNGAQGVGGATMGPGENRQSGLEVMPRIEAGAETDNQGTIQVEINVRDPSGRIKRNWFGRRIRNHDNNAINNGESSGQPRGSFEIQPDYGDGDGLLSPDTPALSFPSSSIETPGSFGLSLVTPNTPLTSASQYTHSPIASSSTSDNKIGIRNNETNGNEDLVKVKQRKLTRKDKKRMKEKGKEKMVDLQVPAMNIVIFIVGSRGDVQPYLSLALQLIISNGHRVRIATHPDFRKFVVSANSRLRGKTHEGVNLEGRLEFFDVGGDPKELMAYMVKNPGLLPGMESLTNGDIKRKRQMSAEMLRGFYRSTFLPDIETGKAFAADAIISNPPSFAHIHVAEALGIPLHMSFTMPWTATTAFPHPLVNVKKSNADSSMTNYIGYTLADMLMWEGLGSTINQFRSEILRLNSLSDRVASSLVDNMHVPWTYCWSPELLSKPSDWKSHIDISGFYFLDNEDDYQPPKELTDWLAGGTTGNEDKDKGKDKQQGENEEEHEASEEVDLTPIYIGFGSVVIPNPEEITSMLFDAIQQVGVRAIISSGWAGLGKGRENESDRIYILSEDCPHDWLFADSRVKAVMHHGGAGTTACGLRHGRPTIIVPFFGDQKFWGDAVHHAGAGPAPLPFKTLTMEGIVEAIRFAISDDATKAAGVLGEKIRAEKGEEKGVANFHRHLPIDSMICDIDPRKTAVWWWPKLELKISVEAAAALLKGNKIFLSDLEPYRSVEYDLERSHRDPLTGSLLSMGSIMTTSVSGVGQLLYSPGRGAIKTFWGIPDACLNVIGDMYEGFENIPTMMGSLPRPRGKVTNWKNGFAEGGKAVSWGLWDGILGFFTDPVDGAMREGFVGFGKGFGRGCSNMIMRPTQGTLALFVLPARGVKMSIKSALKPNDPHSVLRGAREQASKETISKITPEYLDRVLKTLQQLEKETKQRKQKAEKARWFLIANKEERRREEQARLRERMESKERKVKRKVLKDQRKALKAEEKAAERAKLGNDGASLTVNQQSSRRASTGMISNRTSASEARPIGSDDSPSAEDASEPTVSEGYQGTLVSPTRLSEELPPREEVLSQRRKSEGSKSWFGREKSAS